MTKKPKHKSDAFEAIHSTVEGMLRVGTIDKASIRRFDETCLTPWRRSSQLRSSSCARPTMSASLSSPAI
jgi:DNA-binding transcriptional regulator YiaG